MIIADTSIWVEHLRRPLPLLQTLLHTDDIVLHPYILGEIGLGNVPRYDFTMRGLSSLPMAPKALDSDVMDLIREQRLHGTGIGFVDAHLLAAALRTSDGQLWTRDKRLAKHAAALGIAYYE